MKESISDTLGTYKKLVITYFHLKMCKYKLKIYTDRNMT